MENNLKYIYIYLNHLAVHVKLPQYCKSTILQLKKKKRFGIPTKETLASLSQVVLHGTALIAFGLSGPTGAEGPRQHHSKRAERWVDSPGTLENVTSVDLEIVILNEVSQTKTNTI